MTTLAQSLQLPAPDKGASSEIVYLIEVVRGQSDGSADRKRRVHQWLLWLEREHAFVIAKARREAEERRTAAEEGESL